MNEFIVDNEIAGLRERREDREIGHIAATEIQCGLGAEIGGSLSFQRLVLGMVAPQQTRPTRAHGYAPRQGIGRGLPPLGGFSQSEIVVRRKVYPGTFAKRTQPPPIR